MAYEEVSRAATALPYRDKMRLALLMIQLAAKEEEQQNPAPRVGNGSTRRLDGELIEYVAERLYELRPAKRETALNSIGAMFQFQGGISSSDRDEVFAGLVDAGFLSLDGDRIVYPTAKA